MAVLAAQGTPMQGVNYTHTTASPSDWAAVSNSTYFYDLTNKIVYYKDGSGNVGGLFDGNVATDLSEGTATTTTVDVNSSDGSNATLLAASTSRAGVMTKAKFDEVVANNAKVSNVTTDLSEAGVTTTVVRVDSSDGTNATLGLASGSRAGIVSRDMQVQFHDKPVIWQTQATPAYSSTVETAIAGGVLTSTLINGDVFKPFIRLQCTSSNIDTVTIRVRCGTNNNLTDAIAATFTYTSTGTGTDVYAMIDMTMTVQSAVLLLATAVMNNSSAVDGIQSGTHSWQVGVLGTVVASGQKYITISAQTSAATTTIRSTGGTYIEKLHNI